MGGLILQATFFWVWTGLRRQLAPRRAYWLAAFGYLSWWLVLAAVVYGWVSPLLLAVASVAPAVIVLFGGQVGERLGWRRDKWALRREFERLAHATHRGNELTRDDIDRLRLAFAHLDRFRSPETAEFIDLVQEELLEWIDGRNADPDRRSRRDDRRLDLSDQLWGRSTSPSATRSS